MSYILEALKKAEAERQLGSAPTIHAAPLNPAPARTAGGRTPLMAGLGAGAVAAAVAAYIVMRQPAPAPHPPVTVAALPQRPAAPQPAAPPAAPVVAPARVPESKSAVEPKRAAAPAPAAEPQRAPMPKPAAERLPAAPPAPTPAPAPALAPEAAPPVAEASVPALSELPEAIRREVPQIAVGGYIYSSNPADRLLLIDKVLRREGEEVAPGLVLEKLLPKGAVMNFRGYRYRMPY